MKTVKQIRADVVSQLQSLWKVLFSLYLPIVLLFLLIGVLSRVTPNLSLAVLLRDITATARLPFFTGFVSQFGLILWSASLTICLFALVVLHRQASNFSGARRFLLHGSILTGALLVDDVFLFHEEIAPNYLHLNEVVVLAVYAIIAFGFLFLNWKEIFSSEYALLIIALGFFAVSIVLDALPVKSFQIRYFWEQLELFLEDAFKLAGVATWLMYFTRYTIQSIEGIQQRHDT